MELRAGRRHQPRATTVPRSAGAARSVARPRPLRRRRRAVEDRHRFGRSPACRSPARHSPPRRPRSSSSPATGGTSSNHGCEARRLLAEAGIVEGVSFVLKNRDIPMPYAHIGTWLVDQWRQIGLTVYQEIRDSGQYFKDLRTGNFESAPTSSAVTSSILIWTSTSSSPKNGATPTTVGIPIPS